MLLKRMQDDMTLEDLLAKSTSQPAERKLARELEIRPPTPEALLSTIESHCWLTRRKFVIVGLQLCSVSLSGKLGAGDGCVALLAEGEGCMYPVQMEEFPCFYHCGRGKLSVVLELDALMLVSSDQFSVGTLVVNFP
jgi:hypothetical protein